jgi:hypothetical protein
MYVSALFDLAATITFLIVPEISAFPLAIIPGNIR